MSQIENNPVEKKIPVHPFQEPEDMISFDTMNCQTIQVPLEIPFRPQNVEEAQRRFHVRNATLSDDDIANVVEMIRNSRSASTRSAYRSGWRLVEKYCESRELDPLAMQPIEVAALCAHMGKLGYAYGHISKIRTVISTMYRYMGFVDPTLHATVRATLAGVKRERGTQQTGKEPILIDQMRAIVDLAKANPNQIQGVRDLAILLICFSTGLRRAELSALMFADVVSERDGAQMRILIRRSKTDQHSRGQHVYIHRTGNPTCPVTALERWTGLMLEHTGYIFRKVGAAGQIGNDALSGQSVCAIVKRYAAALGLDPADFGAHSLRSGFVTEALGHAPDVDVMRQTRHTSVESLARYYKPKNTTNFSEIIGL